MRGGSREQRLAALRRGNEVRTVRAALKREIREGMIGVEAVAALLEQRNHPDWLEPMKVAELVGAVPNLGEKRVGRLLAEGRCGGSATVGGMSRTQRNELAEALLRWHDRNIERRTAEAIRAAQRA